MKSVLLDEEGEPSKFTGGADIESSAPEYLLFLKKRSDGRYEPVTGQMDAIFSFREVTLPLPLME